MVSPTDGAISYRELDRQIDLIAKALIADGARPGDRAAIWAPNMWEWVAIAIGIQRAAGVIVPLNTRLKGGEVSDIVNADNAFHLIKVENRIAPKVVKFEDVRESLRLPSANNIWA